MFKKISSVFLALCIALSIVGIIPLKDSDSYALQNNESRYSVLVLDASGSMEGAPMTAMKQAASNFCNSVLNASGNNYVAIVSYSSNANVKCNFSNDYTILCDAINSLYAYGSTNVQDALDTADQLLDTVNETNSIKNIVLLSDGLPCAGRSDYTGIYSNEDFEYYYNANSAYNDAQSIGNEGTYIYTLGFFHSLSGSNLEFGQRFLRDLQNSGYYNVEDPDDLNYVFGEIAGQITKVNGNFMYPCKTNDFSAEFFYDDNYFSNSSYGGYNPHLATMSLCLELSIWPSIPYVNDGNYADSSVNAKNLFNSIGFEQFDTNAMYQVKPTEDSIGVGIAQKKVKYAGEETTILAVAIRGGGYEKEWASNFKIGASGDAIGFSEARDGVLDYIRKYITSYNVTGHIKFWVVGYSRGGATANLTSAALDDGISYPNCTYSSDDVFGYTFEAPMGTVNSSYDSPVYQNIHNIINPNDFVPMVAPAAWSFHRYGHDYVLPSAVTSGYSEVNEMLKKYYALASTDEYLDDDNDKYFLDDFQKYYVKVDGSRILPGGDPFISIAGRGYGDQGNFLSQFMNKFATVYVGNRSEYASYYQDDVTYLLGTVMGLPSKQISDVVDTAKPKFEGAGQWASILMPFYSFNFFKYGNFDNQKREDQVYKNIASRVGEALNENEVDFNQKKLDDACVSLLDLIMCTGTNEINDAVTLFKTVSCIGNAHYTELCLAWLQSQDSYYTENGRANFNAGGYRIIRINCPVDVKVYDSSGNLVAYISDINETNEKYDLVCEINSNGEKLVYVPIDSDYTFELIAVGEGNVSVSIDEVNAVTGQITKIQTFDDIKVKTGDVINGVVPAYSEDDLKDLKSGSSIVYSMTDPENNSVPGDDVKMNEEANQFYHVKFSEQNGDSAHLALLTGSGVYLYGSYAQVEANIVEGTTFDGWYVNDKCVSKDLVYRFKVTEDVEFEARMTASEVAIDVDKNTIGGKITGIYSGDYKTGEIVEINAVPDEGYSFVRWETKNIVVEDDSATKTRVIISNVDGSISAVFEPIPASSTTTEATTIITVKKVEDSPKTGDNFNLNIIILMFTTAFGICTFLNVKKRREK